MSCRGAGARDALLRGGGWEQAEAEETLPGQGSAWARRWCCVLRAAGQSLGWPSVKLLSPLPGPSETAPLEMGNVF